MITHIVRITLTAGLLYVVSQNAHWSVTISLGLQALLNELIGYAVRYMTNSQKKMTSPWS